MPISRRAPISKRLLSVRDAACVSIYVPTAPEEPGVRDRLAFKNLAGEALEQLNGVELARGALGELREALDALGDDTAFWTRQAHTLAVFATPSGAQTFQLANRLSPMVEVSDRFHVKPLLRSATFPQAAFGPALPQNAAPGGGLARRPARGGSCAGHAGRRGQRGGQGVHRRPLGRPPHPGIRGPEGASAPVRAAGRRCLAARALRLGAPADPRGARAARVDLPLRLQLPASRRPGDRGKSR